MKSRNMFESNCSLSLLTFSSMMIHLLIVSIIVFHSPVARGYPCVNFCGQIQVKYPFGSGPGCGHPMFQKYMKCHDNQNLMLTTHTGSYTVQSIDYSNNILYLLDPILISTCTSMHSSPNFGLDCNAPFKIAHNIFVLLNCMPTSPIYKHSKNYICDRDYVGLCNNLYTCPGISGLGQKLGSPVASCCVYSPMNLGPETELNLQKLQCQTFTSIYSYGGDAKNPTKWKYGIALEYHYNAGNYAPSACLDCEDSGGVCGYTGPYDQLLCNCRNGINTSSHCYGQGYIWDEAGRNTHVSVLLLSGFLLLAGILLL